MPDLLTTLGLEDKQFRTALKAAKAEAGGFSAQMERIGRIGLGGNIATALKTDGIVAAGLRLAGYASALTAVAKGAKEAFAAINEYRAGILSASQAWDRFQVGILDVFGGTWLYDNILTNTAAMKRLEERTDRVNAILEQYGRQLKQLTLTGDELRRWQALEEYTNSIKVIREQLSQIVTNVGQLAAGESVINAIYAARIRQADTLRESEALARLNAQDEARRKLSELLGRQTERLYGPGLDADLAALRRESEANIAAAMKLREEFERLGLDTSGVDLLIAGEQRLAEVQRARAIEENARRREKAAADADELEAQLRIEALRARGQDRAASQAEAELRYKQQLARIGAMELLTEERRAELAALAAEAFYAQLGAMGRTEPNMRGLSSGAGGGILAAQVFGATAAPRAATETAAKATAANTRRLAARVDEIADGLRRGGGATYN